MEMVFLSTAISAALAGRADWYLRPSKGSESLAEAAPLGVQPEPVATPRNDPLPFTRARCPATINPQASNALPGKPHGMIHRALATRPVPGRVSVPNMRCKAQWSPAHNCGQNCGHKDQVREAIRLLALCSWRHWVGLGGTLGGTRTPNLLVRSQTLYPLSYEGMRGPCALQYTSPLKLLLPRAAGRGAIWETNS